MVSKISFVWTNTCKSPNKDIHMYQILPTCFNNTIYFQIIFLKGLYNLLQKSKLQRQNKRQGERVLPSAGSLPRKSQCPELSQPEARRHESRASSVSYAGAGAQGLESSSTAFPCYWQGAGSEMEKLKPGKASVRDERAADSECAVPLLGGCTAPHPSNLIVQWESNLFSLNQFSFDTLDFVW